MREMGSIELLSRAKELAVAKRIEAATAAELQKANRQVLSCLTERESKVLRMSFGIDQQTGYTLEEVGKEFALTRERIRQVEAKAIQKLRQSTCTDHLKSFLDLE